MLKEKNIKIAIIGLGYVGLPLAIEFGKKYQTLGYDISNDRVSNLKKGIDNTLEATSDEINSSKYPKSLIFLARLLELIIVTSSILSSVFNSFLRL